MNTVTKKEKDDDIDIQSCSVTECTGLIPAPPQSEAERESYEELYPYLPKTSASAREAEDKSGRC